MWTATRNLLLYTRRRYRIDKNYFCCFYLTFPSSNVIVPPPPENVVITRFNLTSIQVGWKKFTLVELMGLANYTVSYSAISTPRTRQTPNTIILPWSENSVVIHNLIPGTLYRILVSASTTAGEAGETVP